VLPSPKITHLYTYIKTVAVKKEPHKTTNELTNNESDLLIEKKQNAAVVKLNAIKYNSSKLIFLDTLKYW
jgi:hypothetical protein